MTTTLPDVATTIAAQFRLIEPVADLQPAHDRDAALVRFALEWLAEPANAGSTEALEAIDRVRAVTLS